MNSDQGQGIAKEKFAIELVDASSSTELRALQVWGERLLSLKNDTSLSRFQKTKDAILLTINAKVIWPVIKVMAAKVRSAGWDKRGRSWRVGMIAAAVGGVFFSGQSAGIAALGGAIGVPLWVVFGAGASFIDLILKEIKIRRTDIIDVEYSVLKEEKDQS